MHVLHRIPSPTPPLLFSNTLSSSFLSYPIFHYLNITTGSLDGTVKLFHVNNKRVLASFVHCKPSGVASAETDPMPPAPPTEEEEDEGMEVEAESNMSVECVGFAPGELKWVASGGMDKVLKVWDLSTGLCRSAMGHKASVVGMKWHSVLPLVATAALDNILRLWDARNGACLVEFTGHTEMVTSLDLQRVACLDDQGLEQGQDVLVSVADDRTARVFHFDALSLMQ